MKISAAHLIASGLLAMMQQAPPQYPKDMPITGKTLVVFVANGCPMMPQGGDKRPLADYANIQRTIKAEKLADTRVVFLIDENAQAYVQKNKITKDVLIFNTSSEIWDSWAAQRSNQSYLIKDGKIEQRFKGSNAENLKAMISYLGIKTDPGKIIIGLNDADRKREVSGCSPMWTNKNLLSAIIRQRRNQPAASRLEQ